jgi:ribosomal protein S18 acetylase RimI-like enzyme
VSGGPSGGPPGTESDYRSGSSIHLREFTWEDWPGVLALWQSAGPGIHLGRSDAPEEIRKKWQHDPDLFLIAESEGRPVGAVMGGFDGRRGIVYHLAVSPAVRRRGIGRSLMIELERRMAARGCLKSYLLTIPENHEASAFYRELGWQVLDMVLMGKEFE